MPSILIGDGQIRKAFQGGYHFLPHPDGKGLSITGLSTAMALSDTIRFCTKPSSH